MPTFNAGKELSDIQNPEPIPEDWYLMRITGEPTLEPSKNKKSQNIVINLRVQSEIEDYHGRGFRLWLNQPTAEDSTKTTSSGQTFEDFKLQQTARYQAAFEGLEDFSELQGDSFNFEEGMEAMFHVSVDLSEAENPRNVLTDRALPLPVR